MTNIDTNIEPLLLSPKETARLLGISRSKFFSMLSAGKVGPIGIHLDRSLRFSLAELKKWVLSRNPQTGLLPTREQWLFAQEQKNLKFEKNILAHPGQTA